MLDTIRRIQFFQDLSDEQLERIKPLVDVFTCPANQPIFEQDEQANYLYLLVRGTVALEYKPYDGTRITLTRLHAGDAFGWSSVVGGKTYTSSITSETEVEAVRIRGSVLQKMCRRIRISDAFCSTGWPNRFSGRWKNSREQVHAILDREINNVHREKK